jgi:Pyruvate/2-oxoacid:ferredoxin oxidoreductase delta subunit
MSDVYQRLAKKLDELPNGFPATESGVELKILRKIFTPEEAEMTLKMRPIPETAEAIAERLGKPVNEMEAILDNMVKKGQIGSASIKGQQVYILFPFIFGIFEFQLKRVDREFAELMKEYGPTIMGTVGGYAPAVMRIVPINLEVQARHQVQPYEDLRQMFEKAKSFQVMECICKKEQALLGKPCTYPTEVCLAFANNEGAFERYPSGRIISRDEALHIIKTADDVGLVHATFNAKSNQMFVCNCCSCCCGMLVGVKRFNVPYLMAKSNFVSIIDQETCAACGVCTDERCPMEAITQQEDQYVVQPDRCIGCGVCVPTCPTESISLIRKPESLQVEPPQHLMDWYFKRAENRGIRIMIEQAHLSMRGDGP